MKNLQKSRENAILYHIWESRTLSRGDIAHILNLKPPTVSALVNDLVKSNRVIEAQYAESSGGRRARLLEIIPDWGWMVGIEFSTMGITTASADMRGEIYNLKKTTLAQPFHKQKIIKDITNAIQHQLSYIHHRSRNPILRIGVAISGLVNSASGISISFPRFEEWKDVPLKDILEKEFHIPVVIENRITAITMAENLFGEHKGIRDALIFLFGPGLGMGMILNGQVRRGQNWSVGEFGHIAVTENDALCYCGKRGCLESLASDYALIAQANEAIQKGVSTRIVDFTVKNEVTANAICLAAADGDRLAYGLIERAGRYIATGIANLLNVLGPDLIVIGGLLIESSDALLDCIRRNLKVHTLEYIEKQVKIEKASFGSEAGIQGAVTIGLNDFYSNHAGDLRA
ncbi:ROK family protein [Candidatus Sumerlaeota bacterium]|nr:ROK family protein [Candidatus Sumerlaeota bacterium]